MSRTNESPTTSSYIRRAGATLPEPPQPACNSERGGTTPGPVLPPHPPLLRAGSTRDQAKGPAKHARPTAKPMTTRMLTNNRPEYYHPRRASRVRAPRGPARTSSGKVTRLGRRGGYGTYNLREWYEGHDPRRKLTKSLSGRGAATLPGIPVLRNSTRGTQGTTGAPHGATPTPNQRARICYAEPNPPRRTERPGTTAQAEPP